MERSAAQNLFAMIFPALAKKGDEATFLVFHKVCKFTYDFLTKHQTLPLEGVEPGAFVTEEGRLSPKVSAFAWSYYRSKSTGHSQLCRVKQLALAELKEAASQHDRTPGSNKAG